MGSSSPGQLRGGIGGLKQLAGSERAVEARALEQEIGAAAGVSHLLGFVHAAVDQEVGGAFRDRSADPQTGMMAFGIVDQPSALAVLL